MNENWVKKRTFDPSQMPAKASAQAIPCSIAFPFLAQRLASVAIRQEQKQLRRNRMITAAKFGDGIATATSPVGQGFVAVANLPFAGQVNGVIGSERRRLV